MKLPIALAALFLAATAALPASARTPTGHSFYMHGGVSQRTHDGWAARAQAWPAVSQWLQRLCRGAPRSPSGRQRRLGTLRQRLQFRTHERISELGQVLTPPIALRV